MAGKKRKHQQVNNYTPTMGAWRVAMSRVELFKRNWGAVDYDLDRSMASLYLQGVWDGIRVETVTRSRQADEVEPTELW